MVDETKKTDVEEVAHHAEYPRIDDTDLKGQLDVGAQALAGQDLTYTKEGNPYQIAFCLYSTCNTFINSCIEARKLVRKIDWHLMPLAAWACGLQFVDKSGLGAAATYGLQKDLGLTGNEYSWCVSVSLYSLCSVPNQLDASRSDDRPAHNRLDFLLRLHCWYFLFRASYAKVPRRKVHRP